MGMMFKNGIPYAGVPDEIDAATVGGHTVEADVPADAAFTDTINSDMTVEGNPVILKDLQGGVPFSEITVKGENISGQEMTLTATGKNQLPITVTSGTGAGVTYTVDNDEITVSGTTTGVSTITISAPNMTITEDMRLSYRGNLSGMTPKATVLRNGETVYPTPNDTTGSKLLAGDVLQNVYIQQQNADVAVNGSAKFQLEYGTEVTEYEKYSSETYTFTPDSVDYVIPTDITQKEDINVLAIDAEGATLSVTGVKTNAAVKKIWEDMKSNVQLQSDWNETDVNSDAYILNKPTSLPASDVSDWAKASTKPTYTASEIGLGNVENKSSATIRSELTKANITDALGYTPPELDTTYDIVSESNNGLAPKIDTTFDGVLSMDEPHYILSYVNKAGGGDLNWYHLPETAFLDSSQAIDWVKRFDESPESARELLGWVDNLKDYMGEDEDPHNIAEATNWVNSTARDWVDDLMTELGTPAKISTFQSGRVSYTQGTSTSITLGFVPTVIWVSNISSSKNVVNIARVDSTSTYFIVPADMQGLTTGTLSYVAFK